MILVFFEYESLETHPKVFGQLSLGDCPKVEMIKPEFEKKATIPDKILSRDSRIRPVWGKLYSDVERNVWDSLRKDGIIRKCSDVFDAMWFNLDGKGPNELIIRAKGPPYCGATGNCSFFIFQKKNGRYVVMLEARDHLLPHRPMGSQIRKESVNGYNKIYVLYQHSVSDMEHNRLVFKNGKYVLQSSYVNAWQGGNVWKVIPASEFNEGQY